MKWTNYETFTYSLNGTSIKKWIVYGIILIVLMFMVAGVITSLNPKYRIYSQSIHEWTTHISGESLGHLLGFENRYFAQALPADSRPPALSTVFFEMATNISLDDPRSFLGRELPGFAVFDSKIIVAGEGTNYTSLPYESAPPSQVLNQQTEAEVKNVHESEMKKGQQPVKTTNGKKVFFIYHTHTRESFLPHLQGVANPNSAIHSEVNITLVGERLGQALESHGVGATVNKTDVTGLLKRKGLQYWQSYVASRSLVQEAMAQNQDLSYILDLHRDSLPRDKTTATINGQSYARIIFVIGGEHQGYEKNLQLAQTLHHKIDAKYPGLSRGVVQKQGKGVDGVYNQDLSDHAMLIEMGGYENTLEENYRTAEALAEILSDDYFESQKVNQ